MPISKRLGAPVISMMGVIAAGVTFAVPANAAPYSDQATTSVSNQTPRAGSSISFCGAGFLPGERVRIYLDAVDGWRSHRYPSARANGGGSFCTGIELGRRLHGSYDLTAVGRRSERESSTAIEIGRRHRHHHRHGLAQGQTTNQNTSFERFSVKPGANAVPISYVNVSANAAVPATAGIGGSDSADASKATAIGLGAVSLLLLAGGPVMLFTGRRRKVTI